jgi:hypothetical protein
MIITQVQELKETKSVDKIIVGDKLHRIRDNFFYELKAITQNKEGEFYYHFYGFVIKGIKNLKNHFKTDLTLFNIY